MRVVRNVGALIRRRERLGCVNRTLNDPKKENGLHLMKTYVRVGHRASVVSRDWPVFRRREFSSPARRERQAYPSAVCGERATKREAKRTAARRVAPKTAWGFVAPRSQSAAAMLPRRALPQAVLGATKHQAIVRHYTSPTFSTRGLRPRKVQ